MSADNSSANNAGNQPEAGAQSQDTITAPPGQSMIRTEPYAQISYLTGKLMERAFGPDAGQYQDKFVKDAQECALFEKYNMPAVSTDPDQPLPPSKAELRHLRYLPGASKVADSAAAKITYPTLKPDLGFFPKLTYFQRLSQNIYSFKGDTRVEEKDVNLRSTRLIPPVEMGVLSLAALEDMTLFRKAIDAESFGK